MTTLHIEHPITDFNVWRTAFERFADIRRQAGVRAHRIQRSVDDDHYLILDLDFDDVESAERFRSFLHSTVWAVPANSPGLAGAPVTRILEPALERRLDGDQSSRRVTSTATSSSCDAGDPNTTPRTGATSA